MKIVFLFFISYKYTHRYVNLWKYFDFKYMHTYYTI